MKFIKHLNYVFGLLFLSFSFCIVLNCIVFAFSDDVSFWALNILKQVPITLISYKIFTWTVEEK